MKLIFLKTLEDSTSIVIDGEKSLDLVEYEKPNSYDRSGDTRYIIENDLASKPASIAQFVYQDEGKLDILCRYNGYDNPFNIHPEDSFFVPDVQNAERVFRKKIKDVNLAQQILNTKNSVIDPRRKMVPTNINESNKQISREGNFVVLGSFSNNKESDKKIEYNGNLLEEFKPF